MKAYFSRLTPFVYCHDLLAQPVYNYADTIDRSLCSKWPSKTLIQAWIQVRHWLADVPMTRWWSSFQIVAINCRSSLMSLMQLLLTFLLHHRPDFVAYWLKFRIAERPKCWRYEVRNVLQHFPCVACVVRFLSFHQLHSRIDPSFRNFREVNDHFSQGI